MSRSLFFLVGLSVVVYCAAQQVIDVVPLEADAAGVPVNPQLPTLVASDDSVATVDAGRPKRQFGLGFLLGSALGGGYGYGYGRPYGYGGYGGYGHGYGHHHHHHHGHRYGYGYGR
ncbi:transcriptional regulatory protein LGE1-like isoform X2 [Daphnia pulex]|uniref:transcriptional regulatory protein LGE1-like isoform X2 n=1 Tax=Daphnia pulex TaxID=6669 RepID=UPI001EDD3F69|nr:transcriptional regulatory protein LGE1-like isoform X2 [Daphnia pulex]